MAESINTFSQASSYANYLKELVAYKPKSWGSVLSTKLDEQTTLAELYKGAVENWHYFKK